MQLSEKAKKDLKEVIAREIGEDRANSFSDDELNDLGLLFLNILAENLKMRVTSPELFIQKCK